ncbi:hypothetical protein ACIQMR_37975 [Streptomyces sp. NPDC091376]|uniref:hypothetical protein n=1 Tax=Streptomyces sp. NPDC091376 TaxID=3365994 RepID=UPI00380AC7FD
MASLPELRVASSEWAPECGTAEILRGRENELNMLKKSAITGAIGIALALGSMGPAASAGAATGEPWANLACTEWILEKSNGKEYRTCLDRYIEFKNWKQPGEFSAGLANNGFDVHSLQTVNDFHALWGVRSGVEKIVGCVTTTTYISPDEGFSDDTVIDGVTVYPPRLLAALEGRSWTGGCP